MMHKENRRMAHVHTRLRPGRIGIISRFAGLWLALAFAMAFWLSPASVLASPFPSVNNTTGLVGGPNMLIKAGFDGRYRDGNWVPIYITLHNTGADFNGTLSASNPLGPIMETAGFTTIPVSTYQVPVTLPHGAQRQVTLYLPVSSIFGAVSIAVQLLDRYGSVVQSQTVLLHSLYPEDVLVGLLSDQTTSFGPLQALTLPSQNGSVVVQFLDAQTMPGMAAALTSFSLIVLDDFMTSSLSQQQVKALQTWVHQGGALIEVGGPQWRRTLRSLPAGLLPVRIYGTGTLSPGTHLLPVGGPTAEASSIIGKAITVSTATVQAYARAIVSAGTTPLLVQTQYGQGSIAYLAFDPTVEPVVDWSGAPTLWKGLLLRSLGEQLLPSAAGASPGVSTSYALAKLQHALLPYTTLSPWVLALFFLGYLVILGPARWLIVHRLKQRAWSWRILLSAIVIFSLLNVEMAFYEQGASMLSNSLSIVRLNSGDAVAHSTAYVGVYAPFISANGTVRVHFPGHTLVQPFADYVLRQEPATITSNADGTDVNVPPVDLSALEAFQVEQDLPVQGGIVSHLVLAHGTLMGRVTNTLQTALSDAYVLMPHSVVRLGKLGPGQTSNIRLMLPGSASNVGLPTCGSLVKQVTASSGGLPAEYGRLFYHDVQRPLSEGQRHVSFLAFLLNSLQCDISSLGAAGSPAMLIGWADQPLDGVNTLTFNGIHPGGLHETLLLAPLDIAYAATSLTLPADVLPGQLVGADAVSIRRLSAVSYALTKGQMTFEYSVPPAARFQVMTFSEPADSSTQPYGRPGGSLKNAAYVALYNWRAGSWDAITLTPSATFSTQNTAAYLGPAGQVLVQYVNQESNLGIVAFTKPTLTAM